jgi:hypothetical protein
MRYTKHNRLKARNVQVDALLQQVRSVLTQYNNPDRVYYQARRTGKSTTNILRFQWMTVSFRRLFRNLQTLIGPTETLRRLREIHEFRAFETLAVSMQSCRHK